MNLTKTAKYVKRFSKFLILLVGVYYLFTLVIFPGSTAIFKAIFVKSVPTNPIYGQLDQLRFVQKNTGESSPEFILDTPNGKLPQDIPDRMKVYKFRPQQYSYLAGTNAIDEARTLGFNEENLVSDLKGTVYGWRNSLTTSTLSIDINSRVITINTNLTGKESYFTKGAITETSAKETAKEIMESIYRFNDELYPEGDQKVTFGSYTNNRVRETTEENQAQVAMVDFYRSIDEYPILGQDPSRGLMRIVVRKQSNKPDPMNNPILEAHYWEIDTETKSSYPIVPVSSAWNEVSKGKGIIVSVVPRSLDPFENYSPVQVDKIFVDNIYLAYYETNEYQAYLQPVYVFSGTYTTNGSQGGDIVLYYPAITADLIKSNGGETTE